MPGPACLVQFARPYPRFLTSITTPRPSTSIPPAPDDLHPSRLSTTMEKQEAYHVEEKYTPAGEHVEYVDSSAASIEGGSSINEKALIRKW